MSNHEEQSKPGKTEEYLTFRMSRGVFWFLVVLVAATAFGPAVAVELIGLVR